MRHFILKIAACIVMVSALFLGCSQKESKSNKLIVWSFTDEINQFTDRFKTLYPDVEVEVTIVPNEEYLNKIRPALQSGKNAPDVFTGEFAVIKELVESGYYDDLKQAPYNADVSDLVPYQVEMGTDSKGVLRAISWQTTPGGFYYRRSYAKKLFGTDDPKVIAEKLSSPEKFLDTAREVKELSKGEIKLIAGYADYMWYPLSLRKSPFVDDKNNFNIDPQVVNYFDIAKTMRNEKLTAEINQWGPAWFDGMKKDGKVFGYILPTWGLSYVLKSNAPDSSGDWAVTTGPAPYFWGGTWVGIFKGSKNKELAWKLVNMMTLDESTLKWWAETTGDFIGNTKVFTEIKDSFSEEYLGGQNHYEFFAEQAGFVNAKIITRYDLEIRNMMMQSISEYVEGKATLDEAIKHWKQNVHNAYPQINIE